MVRGLGLGLDSVSGW